MENLNISILVDIRASPDSVTAADFSQSILREKLSAINIIYHWAGRQFGDDRELNRNSKHSQLSPELASYADYMQGSEFPAAIIQLTNLVSRGRTCLMCAESRSIMSYCDLIADYLVLHGLEVDNIHSDSNVVEHLLSGSARHESVELIYDRETKN